MRAEFFDRQDERNPLNGCTVTTSMQLGHVMSALGDRSPFFAELLGDNGYKLLVGIGPDMGCVQFSAADGSPPYLMAVSVIPSYAEDHACFLVGNTPTPVAKRHILPVDVVWDIAEYFIETGRRKEDIRWEEL